MVLDGCGYDSVELAGSGRVGSLRGRMNTPRVVHDGGLG